MKRTIVLMVIAVTFVACKQTSKEKDIETEVIEEIEADMESGWANLFDGSSFENWRGYLTEEMYPEWAIVDGAMAFTPGDKDGKDIISKETYTNFILSLEWKASEAGNSGIFWSVYEDEKYPEAYQTGPEIQVLDNERHPDSKVVNETHKAGSLYGMIGCPDEFIKPAGEWNLCVLEINHKTNMGKVTMNGHEALTFPVHGTEWDSMVANSKFKGWEGFGKYQTGHIGLQDHRDKVWFRNIKIRVLD